MLRVYLPQQIGTPQFTGGEIEVHCPKDAEPEQLPHPHPLNGSGPSVKSVI